MSSQDSPPIRRGYTSDRRNPRRGGSALLRRGPRHVAELLEDLTHWLVEYGYPSVADMQGARNARRCLNPEVLGRANHARLLQTWSPVR